MNLRPFLGLILDRSTGAISVESFAIDLEADEWVLLLLRSDDPWDGRKARANDLLAWTIPSSGARNPIEIPIEYIGGLVISLRALPKKPRGRWGFESPGAEQSGHGGR